MERVRNDMKKTRLDELLVERGYFESADDALRAVLAQEEIGRAHV